MPDDRFRYIMYPLLQYSPRYRPPSLSLPPADIHDSGEFHMVNTMPLLFPISQAILMHPSAGSLRYPVCPPLPWCGSGFKTSMRDSTQASLPSVTRHRSRMFPLFPIPRHMP